MQRHPQAFRLPHLARKEWALVALGLAVWVALAFGGVWLVHQLIRPKAACGGQIEARTAMPRSPSASPRNALQLLTGTGRCQ